MRVHSQVEKGEKLTDLVRTYLSSEANELRYSILALLLHLSDKPLLTTLPDTPLHQSVEPHRIDLQFTSEEAEQLYEGWGNFSSSSESELSEVEDESQPMELINERVGGEQEQPPPTDNLVAKPRGLQDKSTMTAAEPQATLAARYASNIQAIEARATGLRVMHWPYVTVSEAEVVDQLFMVFFGVNTRYFEYKPTSGYRQVAPLQLTHLTPHALEQALRFYLQFASELNFIRDTVELCSNQPSLVIQAFGQACQEFVSEVKFAIVKLQKEFAIHNQTVPASAFDLESARVISLLSLRVKLQSWKELVSQVHSTIAKSLLEQKAQEPEGLDESSSQYSTAYRSNFLITCLYTLLKDNHELVGTAATQLSVKLFLKTLEPFLAMLNSWVALGELWDPANEFMVFQVKQLQGSNYSTWKENSQIRTQELANVTHRQGHIAFSCPSFLVNSREHILVAGKARDFIRHLESEFFDAGSTDKLSYLSNQITSSLLQRLGDWMTSIELPSVIAPPRVHYQPDSSRPADLPDIQPRLSFQWNVEAPPPLLMPSTFEFSWDSLTISKPKSKATHPKAWVDFEDVVQRHLVDILDEVCIVNSRRLLHLFHDHLSLADHFEALKCVYFQSNGHALSPFLLNFFKKLDRYEVVDNAYEATAVLNTCLKAFPWSNLAEAFVFKLEGEPCAIDSISALDHLKLTFTPKSPLDIIFDRLTLDKYQKVFTRLLHIKRAAYCARKIRWRQRGSAEPIHHKLSLFQKELEHFCYCFEEYMMLHVLDVQAVKFQEAFRQVDNIDSLRQIHNVFLNKVCEKCLLEQKFSAVNQAVSNVLEVCIEFKRLVDSKAAGTTRLQELKDKYRNANRFLLQVLKNFSMRKKRTTRKA
jgi:hypothetical protein